MENKKRNKVLELLQGNMAPILFTLLCLASIRISGQNASYVVTETASRVGRNAILIISLILPIFCGMGLNFSTVSGAMTGEIGLIPITHWSYDGLKGIILAGIIATVLSIVPGTLTGILFNKVKGQEMITGMILGLFAVGAYGLISTFMVGSMIPMINPEVMLNSQNETGKTIYAGLRNTIDFHAEMKYAVDNAWKVMFVKLLPWLLAVFAAVTVCTLAYKVMKKKSEAKEALLTTRGFLTVTILLAILQILMKAVKSIQKAFFTVQTSMPTATVIAVICLSVVFITKTKFGQDTRTVGMNMQVATATGIDVDKTRVMATVLPTMIVSWGQIIFLQNIGNAQAFNSYEQVGTYTVAALLVGGASIDKATVGQVFPGTILFHILPFMTPLASKVLFNDLQLGEHFRVFLCYGIIAISLIPYTWRKVVVNRRRVEEENRQQLAELDAKQEEHMSDINTKDFAKAVEDQVIGRRRELHQCSELGMKTVETEKIILRVLEGIGIDEVRSGIGGKDCHGVIVIIHGALPGRCLGIRIDCDTFPILEETGLSFASKNPGCMHACGHDGHMVTGLGIAKILYENRDKLKGTMKMTWQPSEEGDNGALKMIEDGVLENPKVDVMIGHHSGTSRFQEVVLVQIGQTYELSLFCITGWWVKSHGKSTHIVEPHLGVDPLLIACYVVTELQTVSNRRKQPNKPVIRAVSMFRVGDKNSIIPNTCCLEGFIRSNNEEDQECYYQRLGEILQGMAETMCYMVEVGYGHYLGATDNDPEMVKKLVPIAKKALGKENVIKVEIVTPGGEDFNGFTERVLCAYYYHGGDSGDERDFPQHSSRFGLNEQTLWPGVAIMTQFTFDWQDM